MIIRSGIDGKETEAEVIVTREQSRSVPWLVVHGKSISPYKAHDVEIRIVSATDEERNMLREGGYRLPD